MKHRLVFVSVFIFLLALTAAAAVSKAARAQTVPPPTPRPTVPSPSSSLCVVNCLFLPALDQEPLWTGMITAGVNNVEHTYDVHLMFLNNTQKCMTSATATVEYFWNTGSTSRTRSTPVEVPPDVLTALRVWVSLSDLGGEVTSYRIVNISYEECD